MRSAKKAVADQDNQKKSVERAIANFNKDIASVRARKREQLAEAAKLRQTKHPERPESQLPKLNERMDALQTKLSEAAHQKSQLEPVDRLKHTQRDEATRLHKDQETQVKEYQQNLNRLESVGKGNSLARFGNDVPRIAAAMKVAERNFAPGKAPVGPIGAYIKLKDPKWGLALCNETNWNRGAQVWLVHSHKDIDVCRKILTDQGIRDKEACFRTLNTDDFAVKVGEAPEPTILDIVEIDHPNKDCCRYVSVHLNFLCLPRKYSTQLKLAQTQHSLSFTHTPTHAYTHPHLYSHTHTQQIRNHLIDSHWLNEVRLAETFQQGKDVVLRQIENIHLPNGVHHQLKRKCYNLNNARTCVERVQTMSRTGGMSSVYVGSNRHNPYDVDVSGQRSQVSSLLKTDLKFGFPSYIWIFGVSFLPQGK